MGDLATAFIIGFMLGGICIAYLASREVASAESKLGIKTRKIEQAIAVLADKESHYPRIGPALEILQTDETA